MLACRCVFVDVFPSDICTEFCPCTFIFFEESLQFPIMLKNKLQDKWNHVTRQKNWLGGADEGTSETLIVENGRCVNLFLTRCLS